MNLTSLFSFSYLKENLKKSRAIVLLCIFLVPIINGIVYLMRVVNNSTFMPTINDLSGLLLFSMYLIPVILSITLFSFVYKRKSCDFIAAMPISKKQIFLTNTVGGILVLFSMQLVNFIFLSIISLLFNNVFLDYSMLVDILLIYSIAYIFVFTATNIAVSLASNKITTVIVTLLVLFLIPFIHTFLTSEHFRGDYNYKTLVLCEEDSCQPQNFDCYNIACEANRKEGIYITDLSSLNNTPYTLPYAAINRFLFGISSENNLNSSLIKMTLLSVLYIIIGFMLFKRKKFEVVDTSFKNERTHIWVRSLTIVPIICICYVIIVDMGSGILNFLTILFLLVLLISYLITYDLITRKKITNFMKTLASLIIVVILVVLIGEATATKQEENVLKIKDIETMTFDNNNLVSNLGYTKDKELINYTMSIFLDSMLEGEAKSSFHIEVKTKTNETYSFNITVNDEQYKYITDKLNSDKDYLKTAKFIESGDDVFAISLGEGDIYIEKSSTLYKAIINKYENSKGVLDRDNSSLSNIKLYIYDNYNIHTVYFNDNELIKEMITFYNSRTKKFLGNMKDDDCIDAYFVGNLTERIYFSSPNYTELDNFILDHIDDPFDINKEFRYVDFYSNGDMYTFVTNMVEEFDDLIERIGGSDENTYME